MKQIDLTRYAPPGTNIEEEVKRLGISLVGAACCAVLIYGVSLRASYESLFDRIGGELVLRSDAIMLPFDAVLGRGLWFFYLVALCALASAIPHHVSYYTGGSKSIYLMRRLPQRWEWLRRDITLPIAEAVACLLAAQLLKLLFLGMYYWITPAQCLP